MLNIHAMRMRYIAMDNSQSTISDEEMIKHIGWCGVIVALVALGIAWVANSVA